MGCGGGVCVSVCGWGRSACVYGGCVGGEGGCVCVHNLTN